MEKVISIMHSQEYNYNKLFHKYTKYIEQYRGKSTISKNDARAYICALTDIIAIENRVKNVDGFLLSLDNALTMSEDNILSRNFINKTFTKWKTCDRTSLVKIIENGTIKISPPEISKKNGLYAISLFTGSYGLDLGFEYAGFRSKVTLDIDPASQAIINANRPKVPFILEDINNVSTEEILGQAGLKKGEVDVLIGGPPCQPFSTAGKRQSFKNPRASPLKEFIRVINEAQPKAFVIEEVKGLLNARVEHVKWTERKKVLSRDEQLGSVWKVVIEMLEKTGYILTWKLLNSADYGTPQLRERVIVMGVRKDIGKSPLMPEPTHIKPTSITNRLPIWNNLIYALSGVPSGDYLSMPPKFLKYIKFVPPGGNWKQIPKQHLPEAMNQAYTSEGGRTGFYRRLSLFEPAPTLMTTPMMKGSMLIHPIEDRPISINEYKAIQGFPIDWKLPGAIGNGYKKIGESVPPYLAYSIAASLHHILSEKDYATKTSLRHLSSWDAI